MSSTKLHLNILIFTFSNLVKLSFGSPSILSPGGYGHGHGHIHGYDHGHGLGHGYDHDHHHHAHGHSDRHIMRLDPAGKVKLGWKIDYAWQTAIFDMTVETNGFIGFGLNKEGTGMTGADIVIGGVHASNGTIYFYDCFGTQNGPPKIDDHQDWKLLGVTEFGMYTKLKFSRQLGAIDKEDVPIMNDTINIIWAYGLIDGMNYHEGNRGSAAINLVDYKPDFSKFQKWAVTVDTVMPGNYSFSHLCSFHKAPVPPKKSYIVGFKPLLSGPMVEKHVRHLVLSKCWVPPGSRVNEDYDKFIGMPAEFCYAKPEWTGWGNVVETQQRPFHLCQSVMYAWHAGGSDHLIPEHMGFILGEQPNEYYLLQVHYYNPFLEMEVKVDTGVEIYYNMPI